MRGIFRNQLVLEVINSILFSLKKDVVLQQLIHQYSWSSRCVPDPIEVIKKMILLFTFEAHQHAEFQIICVCGLYGRD